jgi:hypothetical protein
MLNKPLSEISDSDLLDLLDQVSEEVKRRNSLHASPSQNVSSLGGPDDEDSMKRAIEYFAQVMSLVTDGPCRSTEQEPVAVDPLESSQKTQ